ncbi:hypothetical protein B9Z55_002432 [Caenorhabditis nigoni]|uniref:Uncharacterized protein n=1 Tax=Caenorhabditis nigoni TaxID=1611254 RepID=A0A2G5VKP2_9PELO|nr:hypothetical protein B9Z55_002432 [Caenorhabditis nigoni]
MYRSANFPPADSPTVPPPFSAFFKGTYPETVQRSHRGIRYAGANAAFSNGADIERLVCCSFSGRPISEFCRKNPSYIVANMLMAQKQSNAEQIDEHSRQSRSPSVDSAIRARNKVSYTNVAEVFPTMGIVVIIRSTITTVVDTENVLNIIYRETHLVSESFSQRGNRGMNQRSGNNYQQNADNLGTNFQQGYQSKQQRSYQNYSQHNSKYSYYYHPRPIFNSTQEYGAFSVRRQSPSSPSSPTPPTNSSTSRSTNPAPILLRHVEPTQNDKMFSGSSEQEQQHHEAKIHQYRSAGTAPGGYSNSSSPYKQQTLHQPTTPVASDKRNDTDDWASRFQHPPPGIQNQFRRNDNGQAPIELQRKSQAPSAPIDIVSNSLPTTPSPIERNSQYRAPLKDSQLTDSVDAKHPCFADERMHSALYG